MNRILAALALLIAIVAPAARAGDSADALYQRANELYHDGKFEAAADLYQQAQKTGVQNADLHYNLANAELRSGKLGPAIAEYLRAEKLEPRDPDIKFNLAYARSLIKARLPELPQGPFSRAAAAVADALSANEWTAAAVALYWIAAAAGLLLIFARADNTRRAARIALFTALAALLLTAPFAAVRVKQDYFTPRAVIVTQKVTARSGPGEDNAALLDLYEGMDVTAGQCQNAWCTVSTHGFVGWVPAESLERI